jgi:cbb3-type cytochrome oxidase subunit 3
MDFLTQNATLIGLLFFFTFFCLMLLWTFRPSAKKQHKEHANIPLKETEQ